MKIQLDWGVSNVDGYRGGHHIEDLSKCCCRHGNIVQEAHLAIYGRLDVLKDALCELMCNAKQEHGVIM